MTTGRQRLSGAGTTTAALAFGGGNPNDVALTESWNGTNWTEIADLNTGRSTLGGTGTQPSALAFGGEPELAATEEWNLGGLTVAFTDA